MVGRVKGRRLPEWGMEHGVAQDAPPSPARSDEPLEELELMNEEHQNDRDDQGDKSRIEGNPKALGHSGDIAFNRTIGQSECRSYASNRADETNRGNGPGNILPLKSAAFPTWFYKSIFTTGMNDLYHLDERPLPLG